ncbi:PACRG-like protein [Mytilus coruscus]|uniref:PACRG-like protein n=1 Tax=Mytilus coruscus TaxID=42192 RepID=A0A6J8BBM9_MYTCO|nr:PACRG-like protein [Mytilus coruscus]
MATSGQKRLGSGGLPSRTPLFSANKATSSKPESSSRSQQSTRLTKPSDKLNPKTVDPFSSSSKSQSAFAAVYTKGGVPCRLQHGSVKHKLGWDTDPEQLPFDPVLVTLSEGLQESIHPYSFVARTGFKEMLESNGAIEKVLPLLPKVCYGVRAALGNKNSDVFAAGLEATIQLSNLTGPHLNPHLKNLLVPVSKRMMDKKFRDKITTALQTFEQNGGKEALPVIKSKVPTYTTIFM